MSNKNRGNGCSPCSDYGERKMERPEWIISTHEKPAPHAVSFEKIFPQREQINSITLLWDTNSYHVDVVRKQFIINGGRRIHINGAEKAERLIPFAIRRHTQKISLNGDGKQDDETISYIIGWESIKEDQKKEIMIHISPDGREWYWRDHR
jgi:hypothetical protein